MAEGIPSEPKKDVLARYPTVRVGDRLGREIKIRQETSIELGDILDDGKKPSEIYIRTESGNVYHVKREGDKLKVRSAKDAAPRPGMEFETTSDWKTRDKERDSLRVGDSFVYRNEKGELIATSRAFEIVVVDQEKISNRDLLQRCWSNPIAEDFNRMVGLSKHATTPEDFMERVQEGFKRLGDNNEYVAMLARTFVERNRMDFLQQATNLLREGTLGTGISIDEAEKALFMAISLNLTKRGFLKPEEVEKNGVQLTDLLGTANLLSTFEGNRGIKAYEDILEAAAREDSESYWSIVGQGNRMRDVAKRVVHGLVTEGIINGSRLIKLRRLKNFDPVLVQEVVDPFRLKQ